MHRAPTGPTRGAPRRHCRALALKPDFAERTVQPRERATRQRQAGRCRRELPPVRSSCSPVSSTPWSASPRAREDRGQLAEAARGLREALEINPNSRGDTSLRSASTTTTNGRGPERCLPSIGPLARPSRRRSATAGRRTPIRVTLTGRCASALFPATSIVIRSAISLPPLLPASSRAARIVSPLHAYSNNVLWDRLSARMRESFSKCTEILTLSDDELAEKVAADGIDVLIDLSGHTSKNRCAPSRAEPAPLQASSAAYPGTTGLLAMDYYLADDSATCRSCSLKRSSRRSSSTCPPRYRSCRRRDCRRSIRCPPSRTGSSPWAA